MKRIKKCIKKNVENNIKQCEQCGSNRWKTIDKNDDIYKCRDCKTERYT